MPEGKRERRRGWSGKELGGRWGTKGGGAGRFVMADSRVLRERDRGRGLVTIEILLGAQRRAAVPFPRKVSPQRVDLSGVPRNVRDEHCVLRGVH